MEQMPSGVYLVVGILVLGNLGTILAIFRGIWWLSGEMRETKMNIIDAKETAIRAHKRIDKYEDKIYTRQL